MAYNNMPLEQRLKENIKNYNLDDLFPAEMLKENLELLHQTFQMDLCMTDRHGMPYLVAGDLYAGYAPDVEKEPGIRFRLNNRTLGHIYCDMEKLPQDRRKLAENMLSHMVSLLAAYGESRYVNMEYMQYMDYLEQVLEKQNLESKRPEQKDVLTGTLTKTYFEKRMRLLDRAEIAPVALIEANINDWKYVYDKYGTEHSDRLIATIAGFLRQEAKSEYIIGRIDGDVFAIMIPMPEENEARNYCDRVQGRCLSFDDSILAPSIAFGITFKNNVEQKLQNLLSDAEYEMFDAKLRMKKEPGYYERLHKS